jgi:hypothetical protein
MAGIERSGARRRDDEDHGDEAKAGEGRIAGPAMTSPAAEQVDKHGDRCDRDEPELRQEIPQAGSGRKRLHHGILSK